VAGFFPNIGKSAAYLWSSRPEHPQGFQTFAGLCSNMDIKQVGDQQRCNVEQKLLVNEERSYQKLSRGPIWAEGFGLSLQTCELQNNHLINWIGLFPVLTSRLPRTRQGHFPYLVPFFPCCRVSVGCPEGLARFKSQIQNQLFYIYLVRYQCVSD